MKTRHQVRIAMLAVALCTARGIPVSAQGKSVAPGQSSKAVALRQGMRMLWTDHVVWTRGYIVAAIAGDPSAKVALTRLMKNQDDIGNAIVPYYGAAAGSKLTALLKDHIRIAGEVVAAAKANQSAKLKDADARWHKNAADIAAFLSGANPNWKREALTMMLNDHLSLTTKEATMRIQKNWTEDAATFDRIFEQAMGMADALADGIVKQHGPKFAN